MPLSPDNYDPFARGPHTVGVRSICATDAVRGREFPCETWYPAAAQHAGQDLAPETQDVFTPPSRKTPRCQAAVRNAAPQRGTYPLIVFSHASLQHRRSATFLSTHLASHGYVVAAMDHSEVVVAELARRDGETDAQKAARWEAMIVSRVPDVRFLLDQLLNPENGSREAEWGSNVSLDPNRIGIVGHSFGGWTALAAPDVEPRIGAIVALAPGGIALPRPGTLPLKLGFAWGRDIPTMFLVAENDIALPLAGMLELFERTPATKQMVVLRRADHLHFMDDVEHQHESFREMATSFTGDLGWIKKEIRPITELCSGETAHTFVRGLTLCHMDSALKGKAKAQRFLAGDIKAELARRGVEAIAHKPQ